MPRPAANSLDEIAALDCATIRPCDVAGALHTDSYLINLLFKRGTPPFPGYMSGNRPKIYRIPFLKAVGYQGPITGGGEQLSATQIKPSANPCVCSERPKI